MPKQGQEKKENWIKKFKNFESSGKSARRWCQENGEKIHRFKYWREKLQQKNNPIIHFQELKDQTYPGAIEIRQRELSICFAKGTDCQTLKDCINALERCSP